MLTELPSVKIYCKNLCAGFNDQNNQRWKDWIAIIPSWMADQIQSVAHMSFDRVLQRGIFYPTPIVVTFEIVIYIYRSTDIWLSFIHRDLRSICQRGNR